jgi:hypothetical protein
MLERKTEPKSRFRVAFVALLFLLLAMMHPSLGQSPNKFR